MLNDREREELVMTLADGALKQARESRGAYLSSSCGGDVSLRAEVEERVEWEERMGDFLLDPVLAAVDFFDHPFSPGEEVAGRFSIIREVGRGGMGIVYEVFDHKLNRRVALKAAHPGYGNRLPPEVRAASEVSHFNVCKVYDLHNANTGLGEVEFLSMEFLDGETLSRRIVRAGPLAPAEALGIAQQICAGLAQAHRQGVIHGDLKCSNIILTLLPGDRGTRAVITDFGLATLKVTGGEASATEVRGGSYDYMAPELFSGARPSVASDLYALGVILHFMLTGAGPHSGQPPPVVSLDGSTLSKDAVARSVAGPRRVDILPSPWSAVVSRCLEPSPEDRFSSADEVIDRLHAPITRRKWMAVSAVVVAALAAALWLGRGSKDGGRPPGRTSIGSIAVIPFSTANGAPDKQYLIDGISEGLINALAQLPDLKVIARTSSFQFTGDGIDVRKAAKTLGVRALVLGRVSESEGRLRITVELVNGADGTQIWGSRYSPRLFELAAVQGDISREIAERVRSELTLADRLKLARGAKVNPEAYALLLRGRYELKLYTPESRQKAVSYFEQAVAADSGFALANAELAAAYRLLSASAIRSAADMLPKAEAAAQRALAADGDLAEAHAALANIKRDQWAWAAAEREYRRAIQLSPNLAAAHQGFAICLSVTGHHDAAIQAAQRARELDPIALPPLIDTAAVYYNGRRYDQALETLRQAAALDPSAPAPWTWIGIVNGARGQFGAAITAYEKAVRLGDRTAATQCYYAYALAQSGRRRQAREALEGVRQSKDFVPSAALAIAYAGLGQKERAIQLLESGYRSRDPLLQYIYVEAHLDNLREDARFHNLAARIGLPQ